MFICSLCGLELEEIPAYAVRIGNVYRFSDKKVERTTESKATKRNPDRKALTETQNV